MATFSFTQNGFSAHYGSPDITTLIEAPEGCEAKWFRGGARNYLVVSRDGSWPVAAPQRSMAEVLYMTPLHEQADRSGDHFDPRAEIWIAVQGTNLCGVGTWFFFRPEEEGAYYVCPDINITRNGKDTSAAENLLAAMVMGGGE